MKLKNKVISLILTVMFIFTMTGAAIAADSGSESQQTNNAVPAKPSGTGIKIDLHHVLFEATVGTDVAVRETLKVNNTSNSIYSGEETADGNKKVVLKVSLPDSYKDLKVTGISQDSYTITPEGLVTTSPLNPGVSQISITYLFNSDDVFYKTLNYPTETMYFLAPKGQLRLKGEVGVIDYGIQNLQGSEYHVLLGNQFSPSQKIALTMDPTRVGQGYSSSSSGFHSASHLQKWYESPLASTNPHMWVAVTIILFFAAVAVTGYYLKRKYLLQKEKETEERLAGMLDNLVIRQKRLLAKINALDRQNDAGEISSADYTSLREQYMDKLVKIKLKIKELEALENAGLTS